MLVHIEIPKGYTGIKGNVGMGFPGGTNLPADAGDIRGGGSIPGSGRPFGGGHGNPLQCSCLENPMDRGAWWATVHGVANSWTLLKQFSMHACANMKVKKKNL